MSDKLRVKLIILISSLLAIIFAFILYSFFSIDIKLIGNDQITLNYSEKYKEPGYKASVIWLDTTSDVVKKTNLKKDVGTYKIKYSYAFLWFIAKAERTIKVVDKEKPEIKLKDGDLIQIYEKENFNEPGFQAIDNRDGDITKRVKVEGSVDTSKIGDYVIKYRVTDSSGNEQLIERKVKVIKDDRVKPPVYTNVTAPTSNYVIVGDSNIKNMYLNGFISKEHAWAIPCLHAKSMQTTAVNIYGTENQMTVLQATANYKPEKMVLYFGAFSTAWITEEEFDTNAQSMIDQIKSTSPGTRIYLLSILPITQNGPNINQFSQARIDYFNTKIKTIADNNGLTYIEAAAAVKDQAGYGNVSYYVNDGYHLNATGHRILRNVINANV